MLALLGPFRVHEGVLPRRGLRQARQHGGFRRREVGQVLAEVDVGGRGEAVGPAPEEDLVHVQLEDLVLGEVRLDLERQEELGELAGDGLLPGEEEVARHLHGDRARPLPAPLQVGEGGAGDPGEIDAAMLVEPVVLGREDRVLHDRRHVLDLDDGPLLLPELADQLPFRAVDPQGDLRPVVGQDLEGRQVRPQQDDRERAHSRGDENQRHGNQRGVEPPTGGHGQNGLAAGQMIRSPPGGESLQTL